MISKKTSYPPLGTPPLEYRRSFLDGLVRTLSSIIYDLTTAQDVKVTGINFTSYPTNGGGLRPGDVWVDADGFLRVVRENDAFVVSSRFSVSLGTVSATVS